MQDTTGGYSVVNPFARYAAQLTRLGYDIVPTVGKRALVEDWPRYCFKPADSVTYGACNIGVLTARCPCLDVDCEDEAAVAAIAGLFPHSPRRVGRAPRIALYFRTAEPFKKLVLRMIGPGGEKCVVEWLGDGQQSVVLGLHPDTGGPYRWNGTGCILTTPYHKLPVIDGPRAATTLEAIAELLESRGYRRAESAPAEGQARPGLAQLAGADVDPMPGVEGAPTAVLAALDRLDPTPREQWVAVGHHLKATGAAWAFDAWLAWSRRSPAYEEGDEARWDGFRPERSGGRHALTQMAGVVDDGLDELPMEEPEPAAARRGLVEWPTSLVVRPVSWLVKGFIERDALGLLWGEPGTLKSFVAFDLALSVLFGVPWLGRYPVSQGEVLIIAGEGLAGLHRRIAAWCAARGLPPEIAGGGLGISRRAIQLNLNGVEQAERLVSEVRAAGRRPVFGLVDTVARNMAGDENSQQDMNALISAMDFLRGSFGGSTWTGLHHANKKGEVRGSTVLRGAVDFEYELVRPGPALRVQLVNRKMKDAEMPPPVWLEGRVVDLGTVEEDGVPVPINSLAMWPSVQLDDEEKGNDMEGQVLEFIRQRNAESVEPSKREVVEGLRKGRPAVLEAIKALQAAGKVTGGHGTGKQAVGLRAVEEGLDDPILG